MSILSRNIRSSPLISHCECEQVLLQKNRFMKILISFKVVSHQWIKGLSKIKFWFDTSTPNVFIALYIYDIMT